MRKSIYNIIHRLIAGIIVTLLIITVVLGLNLSTTIAFAENNYTDVLTDLQTDESFNADDYPADSSDYSLYVIQIAESENSELFIYVYQPSFALTPLTATQINMSLYEWHTTDESMGNSNASYSLYDLTLISQKGVFQKYKVDNFTTTSDDVRYYDIATIYRAFNADIDEETDDDNTINGIAFEVAQCWAVSTDESGNVTYEMQQSEVVTITGYYVGYIRYRGGYTLSWLQDYCDSHFIAFSTDYDIDELISAKVAFVYQTYDITTTSAGVWSDYGDEVSEEVTLTYTDIASYTGSGFFAKTFTFERIISAGDFVSAEDIEFTDSEAETKISDQEWVLCFYESDYTTASSSAYYQETGTLVSEVTILQLEFVSDGVIYNLGVVMNKVTGSGDPVGTDSYSSGCENLEDILTLILGVLLIVVLLIIFAPVLPYIAKFIVWIISLPFKLISAIYKAIKKKDKTSNTKTKKNE